MQGKWEFCRNPGIVGVIVIISNTII